MRGSPLPSTERGEHDPPSPRWGAACYHVSLASPRAPKKAAVMTGGVATPDVVTPGGMAIPDTITSRGVATPEVITSGA